MSDTHSHRSVQFSSLATPNTSISKDQALTFPMVPLIGSPTSTTDRADRVLHDVSWRSISNWCVIYTVRAGKREKNCWYFFVLLGGVFLFFRALARKFLGFFSSALSQAKPGISPLRTLHRSPVCQGPSGHDWPAIAFGVLVWTGACYWHGVGGFVFNSPSSSPTNPLAQFQGIIIAIPIGPIKLPTKPCHGASLPETTETRACLPLQPPMSILFSSLAASPCGLNQNPRAGAGLRAEITVAARSSQPGHCACPPPSRRSM